MTDYSAIILAGGKSSRMGQKKAELLLQGKTFIDVILGKLNEAGIQEIIISGYDYKSNQYIYAEDIYKNKGPLAGIHAGLCRSTAKAVLVITEDAPLVPVWFMKTLLEEHERSDLPVTIATCNGRLQPLLGIYDKKLSGLCEEILCGESTAVRMLLDKTGYIEVAYPGNEMDIRGCNTPEEFNDISVKSQNALAAEQSVNYQI